MISLPDRELVVVDIETTEVALAETSATFPEPVEIGAIRVTSTFDVIEEFQTLIQPVNLESFTEFSEGLTGISRVELGTADPFKTAWRAFAEFTGFNSQKLVSWGAPFDYAVLNLAYLRAGLGYPHAYPIIDALSMAYWAAGEWGFVIPRWSLGNACKRFGVPVEKKHRALGGAQACVSVFQAIAAMNVEELEL